MNATAALIRFWWLVVAGVAAGALVAVLVYSLEAEAKHTATARVFVNSPSAPYLRTQETQLRQQGPKVSPSRNTTAAGLRAVTATTAAPDTETLVNAANLYPLLIESDAIAQIRESSSGRIPGTVKANALNASTNTFGVFRPSSLPIVEVKATSRKAADADKLASATVQAFATWIVQKQKAARIPAPQRIAVQQLQQPVLTTTGGPSAGLPLFIGALVLLAFCGLAVVLDSTTSDGAAERTRKTPGTASPRLDG
jgi:hypothetical protein